MLIVIKRLLVREGGSSGEGKGRGSRQNEEHVMLPLGSNMSRYTHTEPLMNMVFTQYTHRAPNEYIQATDKANLFEINFYLEDFT